VAGWIPRPEPSWRFWGPPPSRPNLDPKHVLEGSDHRPSERTQQTRSAPCFEPGCLPGLSPASTFKVITALAAPWNRCFPPRLPRFLNLQSFCFTAMLCRSRCYPQHRLRLIAHGREQQTASFTGSALQLGPKTVQARRRLGFGSPHGIELDEEESAGLAGDPPWKPGATLKEGKGGTSVARSPPSTAQGAEISVTPLQWPVS